jgi:hypothetical protein
MGNRELSWSMFSELARKAKARLAGRKEGGRA